MPRRSMLTFVTLANGDFTGLNICRAEACRREWEARRRRVRKSNVHTFRMSVHGAPHGRAFRAKSNVHTSRIKE
ncbi:hypothetical protein HMPREF1981_03036 [Bacteroides pyogenes F0041]|uniref:Uncharacterized protein n=1 Tax=Bacteroides pyogenes F0041 TaxID=1321819 RepID=U2DJG7_9BACE|nr:hypothetical protein HMPREF1981_03036 [Bacteroides pyogenes F0041]